VSFTQNGVNSNLHHHSYLLSLALFLFVEKVEQTVNEAMKLFSIGILGFLTFLRQSKNKLKIKKTPVY